jgi:ADP-dependent NAD(P)H-hydrate dehydratase
MNQLRPGHARSDDAAVIDRRRLRHWPLPEPDGRHGKESRGRVFVVGGSEQTPGAVMLASLAALRVGAGKLLVATSRGVAPMVSVALPEARVIGLAQAPSGELAAGACEPILEEARHYHALLVGPGMIDGVAGIELATACLSWPTGPVLVLDAAPLCGFEALCEGLGRARSPAEPRAILTPHAGEMSRICGIDREQILERPLPVAREVAARTGAIIVLKGAVSYVVAPDGTALKNVAGNVGLGTSGSGDVLAGIIAGLSARGATPLQAAAWGVYLHASAGDVLARKSGGLGFLAREIVDQVPPLLGALSRSSKRPVPQAAREPSALSQRLLGKPGRKPTPAGA